MITGTGVLVGGTGVSVGKGVSVGSGVFVDVGDGGIVSVGCISTAVVGNAEGSSLVASAMTSVGSTVAWAVVSSTSVSVTIK